MNIFNNWRAYLIVACIVTFMLSEYTELEGWKFTLSAVVFYFVYDFVFNQEKKKK